MVILITGAEGALGSAVTERFLSAGHEVLATFHKTAGASAERLRWVQADLSHPDCVSTLARACGDRVDAVVHCAGGYRWAHLDQTTDQDWDFLFSSNLKSAFYVVRAVLPAMKKRNAGRIVFISSKQTLGPNVGHAAYAAAKAGINMLTLTLAEELKKTAINVNAVLPSIIDTPANRKDMPNADTSAWVTTRQLADMIYTLTQTESQAVTGALIPVSGRV
jgi:NAD(P)-dependent dehydrogenase (short-subunit alcohol dehydrogenase family)